MNKGILQSAIKNRRVTLFIVILIFISGIYSFYITPKQEYPNITAPFALITAVYPGASPEDVEKLVTSKIEDELVEIEGYSYSKSFSKNSISIIILRLDDKVDVEETWTTLRYKMKELQKKLPKESQDIEVNTDLADTAGMIISLSGDGYSYDELTNYGEIFKRELSRISGMSKIDIVGKQEKVIVVEVSVERLNYYSISLDDIVGIIKSQNLDIPTGMIGDGETKINIRVPGGLTDIRDIENIIVAVSQSNGSLVRLGDIADIYMEVEDANYKIKQDGENAVLITGYFSENENILLVGKNVENTLNKLKAEIPSDILVLDAVYHPRDVGSAVKNFLMNLIIGMIFVLIIVFIGMGWRNALIVSAAIPLSILSAFTIMNVLGIKIHQISIAALIIALGMLVDNAIVISDSIQVYLDNTENRIDACVKGTKEVAIPVLTSTLTTIGAFIPLIMLPSVAGEYIRSIPQVVIITLTASYLVAIFVVPTLAFMFLTESVAIDKKTRTRLFFMDTLKKALTARKKVVISLIAIFIGTIYIVTLLGLQFFPKADTNIIYIDVTSEKLMDIDETEKVVEQVLEILHREKEVISTTASIGDGLPKFHNALPAPIKSQDYAQIMMQLDLKKGKRLKTNSQFIEYLQEEINNSIAGGTIIVKELEQGEPIGAPVTIRVTGEDIEKILAVTENIKDILTIIEGTINIQDDYEDKSYEYYLDIDNDIAALLGITNYDIQNEMNIALMGREATSLIKEGNEYKIIVKSNIKSIDDMENFHVASSYTNNKVLLKQLGSVTLNSKTPTIKKYNREMAVTIQSDVKPGYSSVVIQKGVENKLDDLDLTDVEVVFDGEREKIREYFGNVGVSSIFAIFLIYLVLLLQFKSLIQPIIILLTIPLSAIGSILGLFIFRQLLSFTSLLGIVSLFGIVVNNAIVLMDFINNERKDGMEIKDACVTSVAKRFRPIMLTTITTVAGLLPLAFGRNELFVPMAISLIAGLMVSTLLTLVIIPVVYSLVEGYKIKQN
ncbi:efflux RND transporter permease subunit [Alkaliphilus peptidifermentans]|uniref:efflux RND transporter permease subunit n=1 Tax=Alkaliphilus peptidifermentans TaxID=426129 RepID=UPI001FA7B5A7|nr:efflux RND transporter permease subunit [Alkaliphilus peptidifermentans]